MVDTCAKNFTASGFAMMLDFRTLRRAWMKLVLLTRSVWCLRLLPAPRAMFKLYSDRDSEELRCRLGEPFEVLDFIDELGSDYESSSEDSDSSSDTSEWRKRFVSLVMEHDSLVLKRCHFCEIDHVDLLPCGMSKRVYYCCHQHRSFHLLHHRLECATK